MGVDGAHAEESSQFCFVFLSLFLSFLGFCFSEGRSVQATPCLGISFCFFIF